MQFFVYSRGAIESVAPHDVPHVIISITTTADDVARIPRSAHCREVLRLSFPDADAASAHAPEAALFSRAHADAIWDLVARHADGLERVVVHCDAGLCRSPAVAAALSRVLTGDDAEFFRRYRPNMRVYRALLEAHHDREGNHDGRA